MAEHLLKVEAYRIHISTGRDTAPRLIKTQIWQKNSTLKFCVKKKFELQILSYTTSTSKGSILKQNN